MKAVILAGGKGSRLRPLTCNKPKPMVPLLGRPCMAYAIDLLRRTGIREIAVTLQYLPDVIRAYFGDGWEHGVRMQYVEENTPLGTAGSVKNAARWLDETFVVLSGDALTDFHLQDAIRFHKEKGALATLLLTRVETPLQYGVAITAEDGRIVRFLEKPSWGEVFSDLVNTGIYICERDVLDLIPEGQEFDFSQDLFPLMMQQGLDLYGYEAAGYWSDIGNLAQYRQTQFDMLAGNVHVELHGTRVAPRIWIGQGARVAEDVLLEEPCYIGGDTVVEAKAHIGPYTVIGAGNVIKGGASLKRSVIWNHNVIGEGAELRGATLCSQTTIDPHASCFEASVIGDACTLGSKSLVKPGVKLWPSKHVQDGATVHTSLIWGEKLERRLFGLHGVRGIGNVDLTPDFVGRLASAYGATLPFGAQVVVACEEDPICGLLRTSFAAGLQSGGVHVLTAGTLTTPLVRYAVSRHGADGGVHIRRCDGAHDERLLIEFIDKDGLNLDKARERKIENAFWQEDFRRAGRSQIGEERFLQDVCARYAADLLSGVDAERIKRERLRAAVQLEPGVLSALVPELLEKLGVKAHCLASGEAAKGELQAMVASGAYHLGVRFCENGERISLVTEQGVVIEADLLLALQVLVHLTAGGRTVAVPVTAPTIIEGVAERFQAEVVRTKANPRSLMEPMQGESFPMLFDALYTFVGVLDTLAAHKIPLSELLETIPHFHILRHEVPCPWEEKGRVMRFLIEETKGERVELLDGIKVFTDGGWTLILPDSESPLFQVYAQGATQQKAEELVEQFAEKIKKALLS